MRSGRPTTEQSQGNGSSRSVEVERKYDVDDSTPLPSWDAVPGVASVDAPELRELDARYFDTTDYALGRAGYALRRRSGGPDAGWHIKGPEISGGREELHWPLGDEDMDAVAVPAPIIAELSRVTEAALLPLARIRNTRTAHTLRASDGGAVAEFVDDHVRATDVRRGVERSWREWEFELGSAAPTDHSAIFAAVDAAVHAVGGRDAASASKLARALGL
jgi:inorganic triphosphatase YgiF